MILYKYVDRDLKSYYGATYPIGEEVACPDWHPTPECGNGLHVSETPGAARRYAAVEHPGGRWLAVEVALADAVVVQESKVKCSRLRVLHEVNVHGDEVTA